MWYSSTITLKPKPRGFHLITSDIVSALPQIRKVNVGILHLFLQHTSASLTINENADPSVRRDLEQWFSRTVREDETYYEHTCEGSDDMPAHIKSSLLGCSLTIPISSGALQLGTWQGIILGEHRNHGGARKVIATLHGSIAV
ncbi:secondary thiamine-phosphate synthase enzyme YjbQ [Alteromonas ponticola]|uniref:Secondary thiamine-phosphate synthase enzyme YjbQ n=1 Tax=Alteromonas aquimaris TaxID=2998417 RepID=A0ABT3P8S2_9ALTE|nr:secondary thiamine-phosphate synthase enzyme YjbQ [Alteromonas aquimaris]MCW8109164.1 secondary thiamine-phosphate synthase enzyme YjbQ [Alteromonas aquimaris]